MTINTITHTEALFTGAVCLCEHNTHKKVFLHNQTNSYMLSTNVWYAMKKN